MISLRPIEKTDLSMLKEWRNSEVVRPYVREYRLLNDVDQEVWYAAYLNSRRRADFDQEILIISQKVETGRYIANSNDTLDKEFALKPIGVGGFTRIEWRNQRAELTFYLVGNNGCHDLDSRHLAINALLDKGFNEFNFHKITWPVYAHDPNLKVYQSLFNTESILKEEYYWNGQFQDRYYLSLLKKDYKNVY